MFRVFVKKMLCYVPVVGWSWLMSDVVFLARDWDKDRLKLAEGVQKVNKI
jgi:1-acyl-sn-glycerol-3-phosphate acyltransferase